MKQLLASHTTGKTPKRGELGPPVFAGRLAINMRGILLRSRWRRELQAVVSRRCEGERRS